MKGADVLKARKKLRMTLVQFAKAVGLRGQYAERTVRRWQNSETRPSGAVELRIEQMLKDRGLA